MEAIEEKLENEENLDEVLNKEEETPVQGATRCPSDVFFATIKENVCICKECNTQFIKRKEKVACPLCHSENVISGMK
jgi:Zn finger protein HypA/HybF involved in hydrogenase expression